MKTPNKFLLSLALALSLSASAFAAEDGCSKDSPYPPSMVKSFMKGCVSKPEFKEFCECTISSLQSKMSLYEFVEIGNTSSTGLQKDARFTESTNTCLSKIKVPPQQ